MILNTCLMRTIYLLLLSIIYFLKSFHPVIPGEK